MGRKRIILQSVEETTRAGGRIKGQTGRFLQVLKPRGAKAFVSSQSCGIAGLAGRVSEIPSMRRYASHQSSNQTAACFNRGLQALGTDVKPHRLKSTLGSLFVNCSAACSALSHSGIQLVASSSRVCPCLRTLDLHTPDRFSVPCLRNVPATQTKDLQKSQVKSTMSACLPSLRTLHLLVPTSHLALRRCVKVLVI